MVLKCLAIGGIFNINQLEPKVSCQKPSRLTTGHFHVDSALYFPNVSLALSHDSHISMISANLVDVDSYMTRTTRYSHEFVVLELAHRIVSNKRRTSVALESTVHFILDQFPP